MLINNATYQRETLSERPIRQPLMFLNITVSKLLPHNNVMKFSNSQTIYNKIPFFKMLILIIIILLSSFNKLPLHIIHNL